MCSTYNKRLGLRLSTINQIVEALLEQGEGEAANQATIILKTAMICEDSGIEAAMKYYNGAHSTDEYVEFRAEVTAPVGRVSERTRYTGAIAPVGRVFSETRSTGKAKEEKMIKTEQLQINGKAFVRTYSDQGVMIEREGLVYSEAVDPVGSGRTYTETDIKIEEDGED